MSERAPAPSRWVAGAIGLGVVAALGALLAGPSEEPVDPGPLEAPSGLDTTTAAGVEVGEWHLGLQTSDELLALDARSGAIVARFGGVVDSRPVRDSLFGSRLGGLFVSGPNIDETIEVDDQHRVEWVTTSPTATLTPRPVALVPIVPDGRRDGSDDLVLARVALDGSEWSDVPLPGCGFGYPIASQTSDDVFAMWCLASQDLRVFAGDRSAVELIRFEMTGDGGSPAILERGDKPLLIDSAGRIWTLVLSPVPYVAPSGAVELDEDEVVDGIAAITVDFGMLVVGVTNEDDHLPETGGRVTASRVIGFDLSRGQALWETPAPTPIESLVAAPDGRIYAYRSDAERSGGDLFSIDPASGETEIIAIDLATEPGRLLILPEGFVDSQRG